VGVLGINDRISVCRFNELGLDYPVRVFAAIRDEEQLATLLVLSGEDVLHAAGTVVSHSV
jgi:hypothetical protein